MDSRIGLKSGRKSLKDEITFEYLLDCYMRRDPGGTGQTVGTVEAHLTSPALPVRCSPNGTMGRVLRIFFTSLRLSLLLSLSLPSPVSSSLSIIELVSEK